MATECILVEVLRYRGILEKVRVTIILLVPDGWNKKKILKVLEYAHLQEIEKFILNGNCGSLGDLMAVEFLPNECVESVVFPNEN